jgi:hypothetical protein
MKDKMVAAIGKWSRPANISGWANGRFRHLIPDQTFQSDSRQIHHGPTAFFGIVEIHSCPSQFRHDYGTTSPVSSP